MSSNLILYYSAASPPARACLLIARYLKLEVELKEVNILAGEQKGEAFKKVNPAGKIPVLIDGDFVLTESKAIMAYLVSTRSPGSDLYPTDPKARAMVDQRLYYDATKVFPSIALLVVSFNLTISYLIKYFRFFHFYQRQAFNKIRIVSEENKSEIREILELLNTFLSEGEYFAGNNLTIADISILTSVATFNEMGFNLAEYPNLNNWFVKMKSLPNFDENQAGAKSLADILKRVYENSLY